jgi:hypothetical protein
MDPWFAVALGVTTAVVLIETYLRFQNPYRLWSKAFDESKAIASHPTRGWAQRKNLNFIFHHRYLNHTNNVHFNALGMHDRREYVKEKEPGSLRIALFGDTCAAGYELPADQTIAAQLEKQLAGHLKSRRVEVMNVSTRYYCTAQLYQWYIDEIAAYKPDIVIYLFATNHSRRNITLHESGKPVEISQPVFRLDSKNGIERSPFEIPRHPNDMIYLDADWKIRKIPGKTDTSFYQFLLNMFHIVSFLDDCYYGKNKLRKLKDRSEIKDIEKRSAKAASARQEADIPYQWKLTKILLQMWAAAVDDHDAQFIVAPFLTRYHVGADNTFQDDVIEHSLGFNFDQIPERRFLPDILRTTKATYFDTYVFAKNNNVDTMSHYLHPRYAYPSKKGARFHAEALAEIVLSKNQIQTK